MHWTTHVTTGGALGFLIGRPGLAAATGLVSHLFLDIAPHHDPETDPGYVVDSLVGVAVLSYLAGSKRIRRLDPGRAALWGAIGAGLPDTELLLKLVRHVESEEFLFPTHNLTLPHAETDLVTSTISQVALVSVSLVGVLLKVRRAKLKPAVEPGERVG